MLGELGLDGQALQPGGGLLFEHGGPPGGFGGQLTCCSFAAPADVCRSFAGPLELAIGGVTDGFEFLMSLSKDRVGRLLRSVKDVHRMIGDGRRTFPVDLRTQGDEFCPRGRKV